MTVTLLDPTSESSPAARTRCERLSDISGKNIALLDISKPRGDVLLDTIEELLVADGAIVSRHSKPTFTKPAPVDLRQEIATRSDAVIEALAD
jgi:hypothetical protein